MKYLIPILFTIYCAFPAISQTIENPHVQWKFSTGAPIRGGAIIDQEYLFFGNSAGSVYCLDKTTAVPIWEFKTGGAITSSLTLADGKIIVSCRNNKIYALDKADGKPVWTFEMEEITPHVWGWDYYDASPVTYGKAVLVGSGDHHLYALNSATGKLLWQFEAKDKIRATPLVLKDKIFVPAFDGFVYVLNAKNGAFIAKVGTEGVGYYGKVYGWDRTSITTKPVLKDSLLVFGTRDGGLYCLNAATLRKKWRFSYGTSWVGSTAAISDRTVFVGWSDQLLFSAINLMTGKEIWHHNCHSYVYATPTYDVKQVYVGAFDGKLYGLDKRTGQVIWEHQTEGSILSPLLLEDGHLYVGNDHGDLYAITEEPKALKAVYLPKHSLNNKLLLTSNKIAPYLEENGFKKLDTLTLASFMKARIQDKTPSVIVFAHQYIPKAVSGENAQQSLFKKYMENGGKIVWLGSFPNFWKTDAAMNIVGLDPEFATELLEINFDVQLDLGTYFASSTPEGRKWGLPSSFNAPGSSISNDSKVIPLALNEFGRIAAFWKPFGDRDYSGFVQFTSWSYMPIQPSDLETIKVVAEHGF